MEPYLDRFLQQAISFAAIMDPIGVSAMMLAMLPHQATHAEVNSIARRSSLTVLVAFIVVLVTGDVILKLFGIDQHSLRVIGGIILLMMAIEMLGNGEGGRMLPGGKEREDIAVIPLGIPIIFGAGLFTVIIVFRQQAQSWQDLSVTVLAFVVNIIALYLALRYAILIRRWLGETAEKVVTKLMGIITGAIAVQFIVGGVVVLGKHFLEG
jgi:multiple antibiotic resistance protein